MKIVHTANPPSVIHGVDMVDQNTVPKGTSEADVNFVALEVSASNKVEQLRTGSLDLSAFHCEPSESREHKFRVTQQ